MVSRMSSFDLGAWLASSPELAPIVQAGASVLRRRAANVSPSLFGSPELARLVHIMIETMRAAPGVGLAAPQIGVPMRVFVAEDTEERLAHVATETRELRGRTVLPLTVLVNPTVVFLSGSDGSGGSEGSRATFYEGCLSVRGYAALVRRASAVSVTGVDAGGRPVSLHLEGWPARIMQHEMDHLDGVLYVDRMITRSLASDSALEGLSTRSVDEILHELGEA
jgi:peptide deformylase